MQANLHSPERHLIELTMEHADLDALIDNASRNQPADELVLRRLKKRRLALRDQMQRIRDRLLPDSPA
ncbi:YdcH family protein [Comamonadaceae bacterium G21597-S1]|nr:YdcH family protein [Comamonadaceae bacterium G21597-S1]